MKNIKLLFISMLASTSLSAQTHIDKAYLQDYADKFELTEINNSTELLQVRTDRNKFFKE